MSAQFPAQDDIRFAYPRDTQRAASLSWLRFLVLNLFQVNAAAFFGVISVLGVSGTPTVASLSWWSTVSFAAAFGSYMLLLVAPQNRSIRVASIVAPVGAVASRLFSVIHSRQSVGIAVWLFLAFVFTWVAVRLMPPPLRNGERRRWLDEARA